MFTVVVKLKVRSAHAIDRPMLTLFPQNFLKSSKLKEFADDNFKFDEDGGKFSKRGGKHSSRAISPFPIVFPKDLYCRQVKTMACLGKG